MTKYLSGIGTLGWFLRKIWRNVVLRSIYDIRHVPLRLDRIQIAKDRTRRAKEADQATARERALWLVSRLWPIDDGELIRVGAARDGGYLIPANIRKVKGLFSPGVSNVVEFEMHFARQGIQCFLADGSISKLPVEHPRFEFTPKYIGNGNGDSDDWITLEHWLEISLDGNSKDLVLQMDIEGSEYEVFASTPRTLFSKFTMIVLELHDLHEISGDVGWDKIRKVFDIVDDLFEVVHLHANNNEIPVIVGGIPVPPVVELTMTQKKSQPSGTSNAKPRRTIEHPRDADNATFMPRIKLTESWTRAGARPS